MKNPCYAVYTRDKQKLKKQRESVKEYQKDIAFLKRQIQEKVRDMERIYVVYGEIEKVFGKEVWKCS